MMYDDWDMLEESVQESKPDCMCDWSGPECCPVHFNPRSWEEGDDVIDQFGH